MERGTGGRSRGGAGGMGVVGGELGGRTVAEVQLYREDVVQSVSQPSMVGVVSKVGGDSDSEDESSDGDDSEEEEEEEILVGAARVCWINTEESTEKVGELKVIDRAFLHGDIVAKASDPLGHSGTVVNVEMMVDLELPNGEITRDVNSRRLRRVRAFALGDYVIYDMWLGRVEEVVDNVTVLFDDGAKCKVMRADPDRLRPLNETVMDDSGCPYFQGQRVRADFGSVFKSAKWLKGSWKSSRTEGTVVELEAGTVVVYWIAAGNALNGSSQPSAVPNEEVEASKLLPMIYFSHTNWQLGDRSLPPTRMRPSSVVPTSESTQVDGIPSDGDAESSLDNSSNVARSSDFVDLNSCGTGESCSKPGGEAWTLHRRKGKQQKRPAKREKKLQKKEKPVEYAVLVVNTRTTVDVLWQDGRTSQGEDACSLIPVDHLGDHDFWPEQYVMERGADGEGLDDVPRRVGVVKAVDAKQRTASVRWLKIVNRPEEPREFESEEIVSVYELVEHPDYSYCLGDVVIRLISAPSSAEGTPGLAGSQLAVSSGVEDTSEADPEDNDRELTGRKKKKNNAPRSAHKVEPTSQDLSWVGVIIGLQDGDIEVAWADGMVSKVGPQAIWVVNRDLGDSSSAPTSDLEDAEDIDDAASWETVVSDDDTSRGVQGESDLQEERFGLDHVKNVHQGSEEDVGPDSRSDASVDHGDEEKATEEQRAQNFGGPFKLPLVALGLVSRLATGLLGLRGAKKDADLTGEERASSSRCRTHSKQGLEEILDGDSAGEQTPLSPQKWHRAEDGNLSRNDTLEMLAEAVFSSMASEEQEQDVTPSSTPTDADSEEREQSYLDPLKKLDDDEKDHFVDTFSTLKGSPEPEMGNMTGAIKHFDCVKDSSDHHYTSEIAQPTNRRKWVKKIQLEWSILEKNLPDTIYVRVYEERMDLLRAVIVGAKQTPYHDGLFVFDLYMPPEYPSVPPVAHYHSGGLRLNPNLYENGKVCLSLLNTWTGKGTEIWHPSTSSILQVLVSIQGLVLNERPYFNEAGYDKQVGTGEGEKNSLVYNENSFLLSCKSMLYLLRRPPMHFEDLIRDHFRKRGYHVLLACKAYLAGAEVGSLTESDLSSIEDRKFDDHSSAGFKLMMNKLVPKLAAAFEEVGANMLEPLNEPSRAEASQ
ncbi:unnamed protein product [Calypogeia fissa]